MSDEVVMMMVDYEDNEDFREYVDKYCLKHDVDKYTAFERSTVREYHEYLLKRD